MKSRQKKREFPQMDLLCPFFFSLAFNLVKMVDRWGVMVLCIRKTNSSSHNHISLNFIEYFPLHIVLKFETPLSSVPFHLCLQWKIQALQIVTWTQSYYVKQFENSIRWKKKKKSLCCLHCITNRDFPHIKFNNSHSILQLLHWVNHENRCISFTSRAECTNRKEKQCILLG